MMKIIEKKIEEYKNRPIDMYTRYPVKNFIEILENNHLEEKSHDLEEYIKERLCKEIETVTKSNEYGIIYEGERNPKLMKMKRILNSLPQNLTEDVTEFIDTAVTRHKNAVKNNDDKVDKLIIN